MMSSYHYNYYYCYDYYDYPSYCCCSVLLNVFFLSLDDLLHLETSLIFSVPQKDFSNGKTKQNKTKQPQFRLFAPVFGPTSIHFYRDFCFLWPGISQTWLSNLNMMFTQTNLTFHHDRFLTCAWTVHTTDTLLVGLSAFITSFSDCLLS